MNAWIHYQLEDGVARIQMNDGKVNALGLELQAALNGALDRAIDDHAVVCIEGNAKVFCAGFDLMVFNTDRERLMAMLQGGALLVNRLLRFPRPVVFAVRGHALAMGALLLLCADYRVGKDRGLKVQLNESVLGMRIPHFAISLAQARIGPQWAGRVLANAELLDANQAMQAGFLDRLTLEADVEQAAFDFARSLALLDSVAFLENRSRLCSATYASLERAMEQDLAEWEQMVW